MTASRVIPFLETLEPRTLLSGNVTAVLRDGTLYVTGTDAAEVVRIDRRGVASGQIRVSGDADTTVNGRAWPAEFGHDVREVKVNLRGGDDRLTVRRTLVKGDLRIDLGSGNDFLRIAQSRIWGNLDIRGGDGASTVQLRGTIVGDHTWIGTGDSPDRVNLGASTFKDAVKIKTRGGDDFVGGEETALTGEQISLDLGKDQPAAIPVTLTWDFRDGAQGWESGFSDYSTKMFASGGLEAGIRPLPIEITTGGTGFMLGGANHSDDLFMFLKRRLGLAEEIVSGTPYTVQFSITFASNAPSNALGAGGAPGEDVWLKAGAISIEPKAIVAGDNLIMNVDKGVQRNGGPAATVFGNIANGIELTEGDSVPYSSLTRTGVHKYPATADALGRLWLLAGTDSGFEGTTTLYYQQVSVTLTPAMQK